MASECRAGLWPHACSASKPSSCTSSLPPIPALKGIGVLVLFIGFVGFFPYKPEWRHVHLREEGIRIGYPGVYPGDVEHICLRDCFRKKRSAANDGCP